MAQETPDSIDKESYEEKWEKGKWRKHHYHHHHGAFGGGFYFLVFLGVIIFYLQHGVGFWLALGRAIVWPVFLIMKVYTLLNM